jgi:hypothetical protein
MSPPWSCQHYYLAAEEPDLAWRAIRRVGHHRGTYCWFLAAACMERFGPDALPEFDKAVALDHRDSKYVRLARAYLLGWQPDRRAEVEGLVEHMFDDPSAFLCTQALLAMWPVWSAEEIRDRAKQAAVSATLFDWKECWKYMTGRIDESELLEQADDTIPSRSHAHFTLAIMCLADGKREDARRHFVDCVETDARGWFDCEWARGFLALMDANHPSLKFSPDDVD